MRMWRRYTPEEIQFVKKNIRGRTYIETLTLFNKQFGLRLSLKQFETLTYKHGIRNGIGSFRPGHIPANKGKTYPPQHQWQYKPVGSERIDQGYIVVKVSSKKHAGNRNWNRKHAVIWEAAHGKIPKGHVVIFADGNKRNFAPDNLLLVSKAEFAVMNRCGLISPHKDLTKTGKTVAELKILIAERKRGKKRRRKT